MNNGFKKIFNKRMPWFFSFFLLISLFLFCAYQIGVKAAGFFVFAGEITTRIEMPVCNNPNSAASCGPCAESGGGYVIISPVFGKTANSIEYICHIPSFIPLGSGQFQVGSVIFGMASSDRPATNDGATANIWSVFQ